MKYSVFVTGILLGILQPLTAQVREGGPYQIQSETMDSGGGSITGGNYSAVASTPAIGGNSSGGVYSLFSGFTAQLGSGGGTGSASFAAWQSVNFGSNQAPEAAAQADPDNDGISNLLEFVFNLDPLTAGTPVVTAGTGVNGLPLIREETFGAERHFTMEYIRRKNSGVFTPEESLTLQSWSAAAAVDLGESVSVSLDYERVKVRIDPPIVAGAPRFVRLAVLVQ